MVKQRMDYFAESPGQISLHEFKVLNPFQPVILPPSEDDMQKLIADIRGDQRNIPKSRHSAKASSRQDTSFRQRAKRQSRKCASIVYRTLLILICKRFRLKGR